MHIAVIVLTEIDTFYTVLLKKARYEVGLQTYCTFYVQKLFPARFILCLSDNIS